MASLRSAGIFNEEHRQQLVGLLYAVVGPVFTFALYLESDPHRKIAVAAVAALILSGGASIFAARPGLALGWIFPVARP